MIVSHDFFVGFREVDINSKMKNSAILNIFQDIAGIHSIKIGKKFTGLDSTWILISYKVNIIKRPEYGDILTAYTWVTDMKNLISAREFEIRNQNGEIVVTAISNWAHMSNNKLTKITDETIKAYDVEPNKSNYNELKLKKLQLPEKFLNEKIYEIDWNWIDVNRHMNNIYYMDLVDMIALDKYKVQSCSSFEIMYKKEVKLGEKVRCFYTEQENLEFVVIKSEDLSVLHTIIKLS